MIVPFLGSGKPASSPCAEQHVAGELISREDGILFVFTVPGAEQ